MHTIRTGTLPAEYFPDTLFNYASYYHQYQPKERNTCCCQSLGHVGMPCFLHLCPLLSAFLVRLEMLARWSLNRTRGTAVHCNTLCGVLKNAAQTPEKYLHKSRNLYHPLNLQMYLDALYQRNNASKTYCFCRPQAKSRRATQTRPC